MPVARRAARCGWRAAGGQPEDRATHGPHAGDLMQTALQQDQGLFIAVRCFRKQQVSSEP